MSSRRLRRRQGTHIGRAGPRRAGQSPSLPPTLIRCRLFQFRSKSNGNDVRAAAAMILLLGAFRCFAVPHAIIPRLLMMPPSFLSAALCGGVYTSRSRCESFDEQGAVRDGGRHAGTHVHDHRPSHHAGRVATACYAANKGTISECDIAQTSRIKNTCQVRRSLYRKLPPRSGEK